MKKLMMLAALLAMLIVAAVPALAQGVSQDNDQDVESDEAEQAFEVTGGMANSNACQNVQGINNTGNAVNNTGILQYANEDAEIEVEDSGNFSISPETALECDQMVNQAASASGK